MTRNMKASNKWIFEELASLLPKDEAFTLGGKKYIYTDDDEKCWLKNVDINPNRVIYFDNEKSIALASHNENLVLICIGFNTEIDIPEFTATLVNNGLYCAIISTLKLKPYKNEYSGNTLIENGIFIPTRLNIPEKEAFQKRDIEPFFPKISAYSIPAESPLSRGAFAHFRTGIYLLTEHQELRHLKWPEEHLQIIKSISTLPTEAYPFELIIRCLQETKWPHVFLDIYRSIEFLFPLPKAKELKKIVGYSESEINLSSIIEQVLGWRPTEISALEAIISSITPQTVSDLNGLFPSPETPPKDASAHAARLIYGCRNSTVHFRPAQSRRAQPAPSCWINFTKTMMRISLEAYQIHFECTESED